MTKEQFKKRWESDDTGGGITFEDIADCAKKWGIASCPRTQPIDLISYKVLKEADTNDCEEWKLEEDEDA